MNNKISLFKSIEILIFIFHKITRKNLRYILFYLLNIKYHIENISKVLSNEIELIIF